MTPSARSLHLETVTPRSGGPLRSFGDVVIASSTHERLPKELVSGGRDPVK
jgi:hypothetical protein